MRMKDEDLMKEFDAMFGLSEGDKEPITHKQLADMQMIIDGLTGENKKILKELEEYREYYDRFDILDFGEE